MLKGKALQVYDEMSVKDLEDYEEFKTDNLRAYELQPKLYRLQFRGGKKRPGDSYLDCAHFLEEVFEKWLASEHVTSFRKLKKLMLMDQFVNLAEKVLIPLFREKKKKKIQKPEGGSYVGR